MTALVLTALTASLAGSLHCAGMCGPFVAFYSMGDGVRRPGALHAAYHLGRWVAYGALGAVAGWLGSSLDSSQSWTGVQGSAAIIAGVLMIAWGIAGLLPARWNAFRPLVPGRMQKVFRATMGRVATLSPGPRALGIGLASGLLPCGWLYAFVLAAAGTGSVVSGLVLMSAFWLGTVPILAGLGVGLRSLSSRLRARIPKVAAGIVLFLGVITIVSRIEGGSDGSPEVVPATAEHIESLEPGSVCCGNEN